MLIRLPVWWFGDGKKMGYHLPLGNFVAAVSESSSHRLHGAEYACFGNVSKESV